MDGVIVDFDRRVFDAIHDFSDEKEFWDKVKKFGYEFWSEMPWTKDGKRLYSFLKKKFRTVTILSAHPATGKEEAKLGKHEWIRKNLGPIPYIICYGIEKQKYANPSSILIDDDERNISQWRSKGGIGILHTNAKDTIRKLNEYISSW